MKEKQDGCPYCKNGIQTVKTKGMPKKKEPCMICNPQKPSAPGTTSSQARRSA